MVAKWLLLLLASLLLSGCNDPVTDYVNGKFPAVSVDDQRKAVLETAAMAIRRLDAPNLAFGASLNQVATALFTKDLADQGIKALHLSTDRQLVKAEISFDRTFGDNDLGGVGGNLLAQLHPQVSGTLTVFAGIASAVADVGSENPILRIKILPVFHTLYVDKMVVKGSYDVTALGDGIVSVLNKFADNVSGILSKMSAMEIDVPANFIEKTDLTRVLHVQGGGLDANVKVTAQPVTAPLKLSAVAWMATSDKVIGLAQLLPAAKPVPSPEGPSITPTDDGVVEAFKAALNEGFGLKPFPENVWSAVRKDILSYAANAAISQASLCAEGRGTIAKQDFSQQIKFPDETTVDCTPTRDCTPRRSCDIQKSHDDRNCGGVCLIHNPFGGCVLRGNDPICEAQKATQNKFYDADYLAKKADCERLKSQEKVQCEAEKSGEKALCETGKEVLKRLARTGKFANIVGSFQGGAAVNICLRNFALSNDLTEVHTTLDFGGSAAGDLHVKFVPLDIVGHIACQAPWTENQKVSATVPRTTLPLNAKIALSAADGSAKYTFIIDESNIKLRISPSPTEFMLKSMNMTLACQGLNRVKTLIIPAKAFVPELRGEFDYKVKASTASVRLKMPSIKVNSEEELHVDVSETAKALMLKGTVRPNI